MGLKALVVGALVVAVARGQGRCNVNADCEPPANSDANVFCNYDEGWFDGVFWDGFCEFCYYPGDLALEDDGCGRYLDRCCPNGPCTTCSACKCAEDAPEDGEEEDPDPAPTRAPVRSDTCEDDQTWHKKNKPDQDCDYIESKNEKKKWDKKKAKKNCKKKSEDKVKAKEACKCKACDKSRFKKTDKDQEASVEIVVPVVVCAVVLIGIAAFLVRKNLVNKKQHSRASMPDATSEVAIFKDSA